METRSKSQSGKKEINMAENQSTGKPLLVKNAKFKDNNNSHSDSDKEICLKQNKQDASMLNEATSENAGVKGMVAARIDQINNTPQNTPNPSRSKSNRNKKRSKLKMVGAKNGKLSVEEDDVDADIEEGTDMETEIDQHAEDSQLQRATDQHDPNSLFGILRELTSTVKRLEDKIDNMDKDRKINNKKVRTMEIVQSQDSAALTNLHEKSEDQEERIKSLTGVVIRQQQQIDDLTYKLNNMFVHQNSKKLSISGLSETQGENCFHEVANFFKNIMKIDTPIPLKMAIRVGNGDSRIMVIKLKYFEHKSLIFQNLDQLKAANKKRPKPYYISDQLPEAWAERRRFTQHLKFQNSRALPNARHNITVKKGVLELDGSPYEPPLQPPTIADIMSLSATARAAVQAAEITQGESETLNLSQFIGFAAQAYSLEQVRRLYTKLRIQHPNASHISAAFKIPGPDFATNQGIIDDGEHGGGRAIMKMIYKDKLENMAVFVIRYYGGRHLGAARFLAIERAAKTAIDKAQEEIRQARRPPTQQELVQLNQEIQLAAQQQQRQLQEDRQRFDWNSQVESTYETEEDVSQESTAQDSN